MRRVATAVAVIVALSIAFPAGADIYVWRDQYGVSHYTNDLANVPPEFRASAITVAKDWVRAEPPAEPPPAPQPTPAAEPSSSAALPGATADRDLYDAGYVAGLRAADSPSATAVAASSVQPIIQVMSEEPRRFHGLLPVFGPLVVERRPAPDRPRRRAERALPPPSPVPQFQGPAGPPPLGAAGPPPFQPR